MCLAVPVQIKAIYPNQTAKVELGGVERIVSLMMTPEAREGEYVLIHTGYAISVIDESEAKETLRLFEQMGAFADVGEDECEVH